MSVTDLIAFNGELEYDGITYSDVDGWRVRFRIIAAPGSEGKANPFKKFTKRSGDRAGTRFHATLQPVSAGNPFNGEIMLATWGDSVRGWTVGFSLASEPLEFSVCIRRSADVPGTRFIGALVEIDSDENAINQTQRAKVEETRPKKLSGTAAILCKKPDFWKWINQHYTLQMPIITELVAVNWLKAAVGIQSRSELDTPQNIQAIQKFQNIHRKFLEWTGELPHEHS